MVLDGIYHQNAARQVSTKIIESVMKKTYILPVHHFFRKYTVPHMQTLNEKRVNKTSVPTRSAKCSASLPYSGSWHSMHSAIVQPDKVKNVHQKMVGRK